MVFQTLTHSAVSYFLNHYFEAWVEGLHRLDCSSFPIVLRNLKIKEERIKEEMDDTGSFAFVGGTIAQITLNMSWSGEIDVVADGVSLRFSFSPRKWINKQLYPEPEDAEDKEEDQENEVPLAIQQKLAAVPPQAAPQPNVPPRFCVAHNTSEKRPKVEPRSFQCRSCGQPVQTNYAEGALCPKCSDRENRCMCCGAVVKPAAEQSSPSSPPRLQQGPQTSSPPRAQQGPQPTPVFCYAHSTSEQRPKVEPTTRACKSCQSRLQTNYMEFSLCPTCSMRDDKCMICASPAIPEANPRASFRAATASPSPPPLRSLSQRMPSSEADLQALRGAGQRIRAEGATNNPMASNASVGAPPLRADLPPPPPPMPPSGQLRPSPSAASASGAPTGWPPGGPMASGQLRPSPSAASAAGAPPWPPGQPTMARGSFR
eukprot:TRINITY_DN10093_c0_g1_i1.p1 TRINITY_DN10093_c0_g1~~TRINITY_DN10093_c0_g1_i1.p1  ORF type:complete len:429 (+),score=57.96 TRINITY_DN10093_c0_g1_i1:91-1377(+)